MPFFYACFKVLSPIRNTSSASLNQFWHNICTTLGGFLTPSEYSWVHKRHCEFSRLLELLEYLYSEHTQHLGDVPHPSQLNGAWDATRALSYWKLYSFGVWEEQVTALIITFQPPKMWNDGDRVVSHSERCGAQGPAICHAHHSPQGLRECWLTGPHSENHCYRSFRKLMHLRDLGFHKVISQGQSWGSHLRIPLKQVNLRRNRFEKLNQNGFLLDKNCCSVTLLTATL